ncbi:unnamed protein product, partial [Brassica oleracea]
RETTVYVSIIYLIANLLHERAQEGLSSASAKYAGLRNLNMSLSLSGIIPTPTTC